MFWWNFISHTTNLILFIFYTLITFPTHIRATRIETFISKTEQDNRENLQETSIFINKDTLWRIPGRKYYDAQKISVFSSILCFYHTYCLQRQFHNVQAYLCMSDILSIKVCVIFESPVYFRTEQAISFSVWGGKSGTRRARGNNPAKVFAS